jgi:hypothetical protein
VREIVGAGDLADRVGAQPLGDKLRELCGHSAIGQILPFEINIIDVPLRQLMQGWRALRRNRCWVPQL